MFHLWFCPILLDVKINLYQCQKKNTLPEVIRELFITNDTFQSHYNTRNKYKLRSKMSNRE